MPIRLYTENFFSFTRAFRDVTRIDYAYNLHAAPCRRASVLEESLQRPPKPTPISHENVLAPICNLYFNENMIVKRCILVCVCL